MARTLLVQNWTFHTAHKQGDNRLDYAPANLGGVDLLVFLEERLPRSEVKNEDRQRWTAVQQVEKVGERALLVSAAAGAYNEPGSLVDTDSGEDAFTIDVNHAATAVTRSLFIVPDEGLYAVAFHERSTGRGTSGLDLLEDLKRQWREGRHGITWSHEWLEEAAAWLQAAKLKAVQVRRYSDRTAADAVEELGEYLFGARATKNHFLPRRSLEQILDNSDAAYSLIGHNLSPADGDRVFVELVHDGRQKTYAIDGGSMPKAQLRLGDLDDEAFVRLCVDQAATVVFPRLGVTWRPRWAQA